MSAHPTVKVKDLGMVEYQRAHDLQRRLVEQREAGAIEDCLLMLQHPHVFTRGRKSRDESDLLDPGNVSIVSLKGCLYRIRIAALFKTIIRRLND